MTHLASFIASTGKRQADLAKDLSISRSHMSELVSGSKKPGRNLAIAIERATDGAVPVSSWGSEQREES